MSIQDVHPIRQGVTRRIWVKGAGHFTLRLKLFLLPLLNINVTKVISKRPPGSFAMGIVY
jgi:hypothetical protein